VKFTATPELRPEYIQGPNDTEDSWKNGFSVDKSQIPLSFQEFWNGLVANIETIELIMQGGGNSPSTTKAPPACNTAIVISPAKPAVLVCFLFCIFAYIF